MHITAHDNIGTIVDSICQQLSKSSLDELEEKPMTLDKPEPSSQTIDELAKKLDKTLVLQESYRQGTGHRPKAIERRQKPSLAEQTLLKINHSRSGKIVKRQADKRKRRGHKSIKDNSQGHTSSNISIEKI